MYLGKGVSAAVNNVKDRIEQALVGLPVDEQRIIDDAMIALTAPPTNLNSVPTPCWVLPWLAFTQAQRFTNCRCGSTSGGFRRIDARTDAQHFERRGSRCIKR